MMRWLSRLFQTRPHPLPDLRCTDLTDERTRMEVERRVQELERLAYLAAVREVQERRRQHPQGER